MKYCPSLNFQILRYLMKRELLLVGICFKTAASKLKQLVDLNTNLSVLK